MDSDPLNKNTRTIDEQFRRAQEKFSAYLDSQTLVDRLHENDVPDEDWYESKFFWRVAAVNIEQWLATDEAADLTDSEKALVRYSAKLPNAAYLQTQPGGPESHQRVFMSDMNTALCDVVRHYPEITLDELINNSTTFIQAQLRGILDAQSLRKIDGFVRERVNGAKAELALEQVLVKLGIEYREGTVQEDLHGCDYAITMNDGSTLEVDVKASTVKIEDMVSADGVNHRLYAESVSSKTGNRQLVLMPYVSSSSYQTRGTETLFSLKPDALERVAERMDIDLFSDAKRVA